MRHIVDCIPTSILVAAATKMNTKLHFFFSVVVFSGGWGGGSQPKQPTNPSRQPTNRTPPHLSPQSDYSFLRS